MNVVFILWLRQLKLYSRSRARMIGALGQPTLFLLALGFALGPPSPGPAAATMCSFWRPALSRWVSCSPLCSAASGSSGTAISVF